MSHQANTEFIQDQQEDFDSFLAEGDIKSCRAIIDNLGDNGFETQAMILHRALNKALADKKDWDNEGKFQEEVRESDHASFVERQGGSYLD